MTHDAYKRTKCNGYFLLVSREKKFHKIFISTLSLKCNISNWVQEKS